MKRVVGKSSAKVYVDNNNNNSHDASHINDGGGDYSSATDEELDKLPSNVQSLLVSLNIPFGSQFGKGSDVDPTLGLLNHIIDSVAALRDVVKVYKKKESEFAISVGTRIVTALTGEIGKMLIYSLTNDWEGHESTAGCFHVISTKILATFPEIATRQHKVSGKMLLHHTCYKSSSKHTLEYINSLLAIVPSSASCADAHGAIPLHWAMRNKNATNEMLRALVHAFSNGPRTKDKKGFLPLHWAVHQDHPRYDLVDALLRMYPAASREPCDSGGLPLHWAVNQDLVSLEIIRLLVKSYPEALNTPCSAGWLPLHRAVDRSNPNLPALRFLLEQFPRSLQRPCNDGQLPLHKVVDHSPTSFDAFTMVLDGFPNAAQVADKDGYMPLHIAIDCPSPSIDVIKRLVDEFPAACRRPTLDGLLPLHLAVSSVAVPSIQVVQMLVDAYPLAAQHMVVDSVPANENANPDTWDGEWVDKKWTPLSRAIDRRLHDVVTILKAGLSSSGSKGRGTSAVKAKFTQRRPDSLSSFDSSFDSYGNSESESSQSNLDTSVDGPPRIVALGTNRPADFEMSDDSELESKGSGSKKSGKSGRRTGGGTNRMNGKFRIQVPKLDGPKDIGLAVRTSPLYDRADNPTNANSLPSTTPRKGSAGRVAPPSTESPYVDARQAAAVVLAGMQSAGLGDVNDDMSVETHARMIAPKSTMHSKFIVRPAVSAPLKVNLGEVNTDPDNASNVTSPQSNSADNTPGASMTQQSRNIVIRPGLVTDAVTVNLNRPNSAADILMKSGAVPLQGGRVSVGHGQPIRPVSVSSQSRQMVEELV